MFLAHRCVQSTLLFDISLLISFPQTASLLNLPQKNATLVSKDSFCSYLMLGLNTEPPQFITFHVTMALLGRELY